MNFSNINRFDTNPIPAFPFFYQFKKNEVFLLITLILSSCPCAPLLAACLVLYLPQGPVLIILNPHQ